MNTGYLLQITSGALFGWTEQWAKMPEFVPYDPEIHGYREEVAHVLGLKPPNAALLKKAEPKVSRLVIEDDEPAE